jgi:tetratricopeptide (TPR) repeat protein
LKNVPGTEKFKKRLFGAAVEGLTRLSEITGDDRRDLAIARGYAKAGEGFLEVGQAKDAKAQFEESHEILERLAKSEPDTPDKVHFLRLGRSFRNIGKAEMSLTGPSAALEWHKKAAEIREKALPLHEDPLFVKREIAESYADLGRAYLEIGNADAAADVLAKCAEYRRAQLRSTPDNIKTKLEHAGLLWQLGNVQLGLGDANKAAASHMSAVEVVEPLADRETATSRDHLNLALFRSSLADAFMISGKNEEAIIEYTKSILAIQMVREKNPDYVPALKFLAGAFYGLSVAEDRLDKPEAAEHLAECVELRRDLVAGAPTNKEFERALMKTLARAGKSEEAAEIAERHLKEFPEDGGVLYEVACTFALMSDSKEGDPNGDRAVKTLRMAIDNGHEGLALMAIDPDLASVHNRDDFKSLITTSESAPTGDVVGSIP